MPNLPNQSVVNMSVIPDEDTQTSVITREMMSVFDVFAKQAYVTDEAKQAHEKAQKGEQGVREKLLVRLADLSQKNQWEEGFITDACKLAVDKWNEGKNHKLTTLAQFAVECRRAMHPKAREHVVDTIASATEAWKAEVASKDETRDANKLAQAEAKANGTKYHAQSIEAPLEKTFSKRYHMIAGSKGILQAYIDDMPEAIEPGMLADKRQVTQREDPQVAARTMAKLVKALEAIYAEFPTNEIATMVRYASAIAKDPSKLEAAKARAQRPVPVAPVAPVTQAIPAGKRGKRAAAAPVAVDVDDAIDDLIAE